VGQPVAHVGKYYFDLEFIEEERRRIKAGERPQHAGFGLATLRLDGFVSVDAGDREGILTTKPLVFEGQELTINAQADGGSVAVEILNEKSQPIKGFRRNDCDKFTGNSIRHTVTWRGSSDISALQEKPIQLRFHMKKAKLYSFKFQ
ncbi:MAG: hypothetical protein QXF26_07245, partial [Candidatus Bathyarchaeia archaeon]